MPNLISLEGNIGCGKSTTLDHLRRRGYRVVTENLEEWGFLLTKFYQDPARWSFVLQLTILESMCRQIEDLQNSETDPVVFLERSPATTYLFARNSLELGHMTREQFDAYRDYFHRRVASLPTIQHILLFLHHEQCHDRVYYRQREGERGGITVDYLRRIEDLHNEMIRSSSLVIDCSGRSSQEISSDVVSFAETTMTP